MRHDGEGAQLRKLAEASRAFGVGGDMMSTIAILSRSAADHIGEACTVQILSESGLDIIPADTMADAAEKAVAATNR